MTAGDFLPPDLVVIRQNLPLRKPSLLAAAAQAHSVRVPRSHRLPPVVGLLRFLPALRWLPGQIPAHELMCFCEGNCVMSVPVSARMAAALVCCTPGTLCSNCHCGSRPAS